jgi:hypothetical protein
MDKNKPKICIDCGYSNSVRCVYCVRDGKFAQKNYHSYKTLYDNKNKDIFSLAARLYKDICYYNEEITLNEYLNQLIKVKRKKQETGWSKKYLWKMHRTISFFPDLCDIKARKLPFSIYNEIVNASLPESDKHDIRKDAEENNDHLSTVRMNIKERQDNEWPKTKPDKFTCSSIDEIEAAVGLLAYNMGVENGKTYKVKIMLKIDKLKKKDKEGAKNEDTKS